jgi:hypothetical protein
MTETKPARPATKRMAAPHPEVRIPCRNPIHVLEYLLLSRQFGRSSSPTGRGRAAGLLRVEGHPPMLGRCEVADRRCSPPQRRPATPLEGGRRIGAALQQGVPLRPHPFWCRGYQNECTTWVCRRYDRFCHRGALAPKGAKATSVSGARSVESLGEPARTGRCAPAPAATFA